MDLKTLVREAMSRHPRTLTEVVEEVLRTAITQGILKPGDKLSAEDLSAEFGVSRMPVREALRKLETVGLVVIRPQKGVEVSRLSSEELRELADIRVALECMAVKLALPRLTPTKYEELQEIIEEMNRERDDARIFDLAWDFHVLLYEAANNTQLQEFIAQVRANFDRYLWFYQANFKDAGEIHRKLFEVIKSGNAEEAVKAMEEHIRQTTKKVADMVERQTNF
ncbi:MAG: Transcriptional regulator, GntR family [Synergistales bacterium 53_16]|nr:MAG: Transcriptional regulator, GntR family [Synergistales bacterium 53_16]